MNKKKIIISCICILSVALITYNAISINKLSKRQSLQNKTADIQQTNKKTSNKNNKKVQVKSANLIDNNRQNEENNVNKQHVKHINMYENALSYNTLPLSGITELADLSQNSSKQVSNIIEESNAVYYIKKHGNKIFMIVENPENIRHGIDFIEISANNAHQVQTSFGHLDKIKDTENENWEYDKNTDIQKPLRHTVYDKNGDIEFVEEWNNCDNTNPIKYEKKDKDGNVIALKKETIENEADLRIENLLYDKDGNTKLSITSVYEGEDLKRFTYYNAEHLNDSASIINEYDNGQKVKETLYTSDFKVKNVYQSNYNDGQRIDINVFDNNNELKVKYLPENK